MGVLMVFSELMLQRKTTLAARNLAMSQSAVSQALARLRDIFGDELFFRNGAGLQPTQKALMLAPGVETVLRLSQDLLEGDAQFRPDQARRDFRIVGNIYATELLSELLAADLRVTAPMINISFHHCSSNEAFRGLIHDEYDAAFVTSTPPPSLDSLQISTDQFVVVARPGHPAFSHGLSEDAFLTLPQVNVDPMGSLHGTIDDLLEVHGVRRRVSVGVSAFAPAFELVKSTDMIITVIGRVAIRHAASRNLAIFPCPFQLPPLSLHLVRHPRSKTDAALNWFVCRAQELLSPITAEGGP